MRIALAVSLLSAVVSLPVHAGSKMIKFEGVQENCVQAGKVKFGAGTKWSDCRVTRGRWVVTLDFIDMYQAQYCLGKSAGECDRRAFTLFGNRAYTPKAKVMLQRIDPAGTEYDDPLVIQTKYGDIMTLSARLPDGSHSKSYYRWQSGHWKSVEARGWLRELSRQLPKGETIKTEVWPDVDSMSAQAKLSRSGGADARDQVARIELGVVNDKFTVKKVTLAQTAN